jgi:hypothetical protein
MKSIALLGLLTLLTAHADPFFDKWSAKTAPTFTQTEAYQVPQGVSVSTLQIPTSGGRKISPYIMGQNAAWWMGKDASTDGVRLPQYKQISPSTIRFPGGSTADNYFWDGNIPSSFRPQTGNHNAHSGMEMGWELSVPAYLDLLDSLKSEPQMIANVGYARYGTGADRVEKAAHYAAEWLRWLRARGIDARIWEIGNENFGGWESGYEVEGVKMTGDLYGQIFNVFADSLRSVDPNVVLGALAVPDDDGNVGWGGYDWWMQKMLPIIQDKADYLIIHEYFTPYRANFNDNTVADILNNAHKAAKDAEDVRNLVAKYTSKARDHFPISMTEYNINAGARERSLINGLFSTMAMCEFARVGYALVNIWDLENGYDPNSLGDHGMFSTSDPEVPRATPYPTFYTYWMLSRMMGDEVVDPIWNGSDQGLNAWSSTFTDGAVGAVVVNTTGASTVISIEPAGNLQRNWSLFEMEGSSVDTRSYKVNNRQSTHNNQMQGPDMNTVPAWVIGNSRDVKIRLPAYGAVYIVGELTNGPVSLQKTQIQQKSDVKLYADPQQGVYLKVPGYGALNLRGQRVNIQE